MTLASHQDDGDPNYVATVPEKHRAKPRSQAVSYPIIFLIFVFIIIAIIVVWGKQIAAGIQALSGLLTGNIEPSSISAAIQQRVCAWKCELYG